MNPLAAARPRFSNKPTRRRKPAHSPRTPLTIENLEQRTALAADSWNAGGNDPLQSLPSDAWGANPLDQNWAALGSVVDWECTFKSFRREHYVLDIASNNVTVVPARIGSLTLSFLHLQPVCGLPAFPAQTDAPPANAIDAWTSYCSLSDRWPNEHRIAVSAESWDRLFSQMTLSWMTRSMNSSIEVQPHVKWSAIDISGFVQRAAEVKVVFQVGDLPASLPASHSSYITVVWYREFIVDSLWPLLPVEPRELSPEAQPADSPVDRPEASPPAALPEEPAGIPPATENGADPSETMDEMPPWPGDESAWWPKPDDDVSDSGLDDPAPWIEPLDEPMLDDWSIEDSAYDDSWEWWYDDELGWYRTRVWDGAMASPEEALEEFNEAFAGEAIDWDGVEEV